MVCRLTGDEGGPAPLLQWLLYPRTDFTAYNRSLSLFARGFLLTKRDVDWFADQYLKGTGIDLADPRVSAAHAESLSGLAPALIAVAGFDPLRDEGQCYAAALQDARTPVDLRLPGCVDTRFRQSVPARRWQRGRDQRSDLVAARAPEPPDSLAAPRR